MAERCDSLDYNRSCQVCFEDFEENGDHVPRILPCYHTVCDKCIKTLLDGKQFMCPECRKTHPAPSGVKTFLQNKYILENLRKTASKSLDEPEVDLCEEHGKELVLFCKEVQCKKALCPKCLTKNHSKHDVVDLEDETDRQKVLLESRLGLREMGLNQSKAKLLQIEKNLVEFNMNTTKKLRLRKEEVMKACDKMVESSEDLLRNEAQKIRSDVSRMDKNLELLSSIRENLEKATYTGTLSCSETLTQITEQLEKDFSGIKTFKYCVLKESETDIDNLCRQLEVKREEFELRKNLQVPDETLSEQANETANEAVQLPENTHIPTPTAGKIDNASELQCRVTQSVNTGFNCYWVPQLSLVNNMVAFCDEDEDDDQWKIYLYELPSLKESHCVALDDWVYGITQIVLNGRPAIALGDRESIVFRDANDVNKIILRHDVAPHEPAGLCTASSSILLYEDMSSEPGKVHLLDCSTNPPKPVEGGNITHTQEEGISDTCFITDGGKQLLVVVYSAIQVYDTRADKLLWKAEGRLPGMDENMNAWGVTPDGHGHLYVCDADNHCIQMFRASDGEYLECLIKEGEQGFGRFYRVRWLEALSSLVVAHKKNNEWCISIVEVKRK